MYNDGFISHINSPLDPPTQLLKFLHEDPNWLQASVLIGVKNAHKYGHINYLSDYLNEFWSQYFSARLLKAAVVAVGLVRAHGSGAHANLAFCVMPAIYV